MTPEEIAARLRWWEPTEGPLYRRIADGLSRLVEHGHLPGGSVLPPERRLAEALAVSRNTVTAAYTQLRAEGLLDARQGSATRVTARSASAAGAHRADNATASLLRNLGSSTIDLTITAPTAAPIVARGFADPASIGIDPAELTAGHGYHAAGHPELRHAIAETVTRRGLPTSTEQILVTNGAQQAHSLIAAALVRTGTAMAVEELAYPGLIDIALRSVARVHPLSMDHHGAEPAALVAAARVDRIAAAFLVPTFHNPTGVVMPLDRRRAILEVAEAADLTLVDDCALVDLDHGGPAPPPLAGLDGGARVVTVGSLSKLYWGGMRIGWIRAEPAFIDRLVDRRVMHDLGSAAPTQVVAAHLLGHHDEVRAVRNDELRASLDAAAAALTEMIPTAEWVPPQGGPNLWVRLPGVDATEASHAALRDGVAVIPGPLVAAVPNLATDRLRLSLYASPADLRCAIERLATTLATLPRRSARS
ncbi:MAG: PLP-dependent aminotransferase family protein [Acidimicrobiales bacterium]